MHTNEGEAFWEGLGNAAVLKKCFAPTRFSTCRLVDLQTCGLIFKVNPNAPSGAPTKHENNMLVGWGFIPQQDLSGDKPLTYPFLVPTLLRGNADKGGLRTHPTF